VPFVGLVIPGGKGRLQSLSKKDIDLFDKKWEIWGFEDNSMPIFEYICHDCSHQFEELTFQQAKVSPQCPACGSNKTEKKLSLFSSISSTGSVNQSCPAAEHCATEGSLCRGGQCIK
jgi:putative FmdB family regulatory protein